MQDFVEVDFLGYLRSWIGIYEKTHLSVEYII